uniref:PA n=1 Tax=Tiliqua thogotovirus TaxID=2992311 RepID=A0A9E7V603_9ORTO|nr:PA [Tiliqua thogotovirus]
MEKPQFIDSRVWDESETQAEWEITNLGYEKRVLECVKYTVCCVISNQHYHKCLPQYSVYLWQNTATTNWEMSKIGPTRPSKKFPDIRDHKAQTYLVVRIVDGIDPEKQTNNYGDTIIQCGLAGEVHCPANLLQDVQLQDIKKVLADFLLWCTEGENLALIRLALLEADTPLFRVGSNALKLLQRDTDLPLVPQYSKEARIAKIEGKRWTQMKSLPLLKTNEGKPPAHWKALFLAADSRYITTPAGSDQEILAAFLRSITRLDIVKESSSTPANLWACVEQSLKASEEGNMVRPKIPEDVTAFGIKYKAKSKARKETTATGDWERSSFPLAECGPAEWVEEELEALEEESTQDWIKLEPNYVYTEVDKAAREITDKFISAVGSLRVASIIEKWQIAATRIFSQLHQDRHQITLCPIITREIDTGKGQLWGLTLLGPHHVKKDTDNIPMLTLEFCKAPDSDKYPKHTFFRVVLEPDEPENCAIYAALKITSCSRYRMFMFSTIRRVLIQASSVHSQVVMQRAAESTSLNVEANPEVQIYIDSSLRGLTCLNWIRKILCLEFLMAIYNNPQMEGFLANIRRLHMCRHALMERHQVFLPHLSAPEDKCNECVINNPLVIFLAESWNKLPNVYY